MKKLLVATILDILLIIFMGSLMLWENYRRLTGLAALSSAGRFAMYLMIFGAAVLLLVVLLVILICKKNKRIIPK